MEKSILLIRHGRAETGGKQKCIGVTDIPLSEEGRKQAEKLALWLRKQAEASMSWPWKPAENAQPTCQRFRIYSSPLARCRETAQILADALTGGGLTVVTDLHEMDMGRWENRSFAEIRTEEPALYAARGKNPWNTAAPEGETFGEAGERFLQAVREICRSSDRDEIPLVIAHAGVIRAAVCLMRGSGHDEVFDIRSPHCGVTCVRVQELQSRKLLGQADGYLSHVPDEQTGADPCQLYTVEPVGRLPSKLLSDSDIQDLYQEFETPEQVVRHMNAVAEFAVQLLKEIDPAEQVIPRETMRKAALLHDLVRTRSDHAQEGARILRERGYDEIAALVEMHEAVEEAGTELISTGDAFHPENAGFVDRGFAPDEILYYADKRVLEDQVVSLETRFAASRVKCKTEAAREKHAARKRKAEQIEMKLMKTEDAVGQMLCHDITRIVRGESKGPVFKKGHIIREEDVPVLKSVGKDNIYIWEQNESMLHENDAAMILYEIAAGEHMHGTELSEGKVELIAECDGLLKINRKQLQAVNTLGEMMIASRHGDLPVRAGDKIAGMRVIPLTIEQEKMERAKAAAEAAGSGPVFRIVPFGKKKAGIVTTGNEVFYGRIEDTFTPVIHEKLAEYGAKVMEHVLSDDQTEHIADGIRKCLSAGVDLVICTGGMSVDPDDRTPAAIREVCGQDGIVTYGAPVLPGAMFLMAYAENGTPVMGLPGCVMYARRTIFDLVLPRVMADDPLTADDFSRLGEGGLCLNCSTCTWPNCGFGK